ncbi:hypothetical protein Nepgr_011305 [Nepenthes gracilis]|uniref:Cytochrome P450 n=1 Tax=Nepenthes gracilis TaxID=150966 RepID=A0AAD3XM69_NEPGR|nr:hypothetical protein Nepgr_011305 [Nepenthes gracilis]
MVSLTFLLWVLLSWLTIYFLLSSLKKSKSSPKKLPPGPFPLPIFGNLFELGSKPHKSLAKLAHKHGPLMTLQLGQVTTIVISSAEMAKQVLQVNDISFTNRNVLDAVCALNHHKASIIWMPVSATWRNMRKICNSHIFSKYRLDSTHHLRRTKVEELLAYVQSCCQAGVAVDIGQATFITNLNLLSNTFFSVDLLQPGSDKIHEFKETVWNIMVEVGKPNFADYFPMLKRIDPQAIRKHTAIHFKKLMDLFNTMINQRLLAIKSGSFEIKDVLDELLNISYENGEELEQSYLPNLLLDLFLAGADTISSTLEWAMAELLRNPDKLTKAKEELEQVIGRGNLVQEGDIERLSYLQSIIKETFRLHPPAPFLVPRKVNADVELCGFTVPKDAQVLVNAWAIGRDQNLWENPHSFEPERFLGLEMNVKGRDFELIPFGAGRRICPGMPLAMRMLPLMLSSLIHSFNWKLENEDKPENMNMDDNFGITLRKAKSFLAVPIQL